MQLYENKKSFEVFDGPFIQVIFCSQVLRASSQWLKIAAKMSHQLRIVMSKLWREKGASGFKYPEWPLDGGNFHYIYTHKLSND